MAVTGEYFAWQISRGADSREEVLRWSRNRRHGEERHVILGQNLGRGVVGARGGHLGGGCGCHPWVFLHFFDRLLHDALMWGLLDGGPSGDCQADEETE